MRSLQPEQIHQLVSRHQTRYWHVHAQNRLTALRDPFAHRSRNICWGLPLKRTINVEVKFTTKRLSIFIWIPLVLSSVVSVIPFRRKHKAVLQPHPYISYFSGQRGINSFCPVWISQVVLTVYHLYQIYHICSSSLPKDSVHHCDMLI